MPSLPQVLHEAATRSATEIVIEGGQSPRIRTSQGAESVGEVLPEGELFDALSQVLAPEQQAELAVGNVVEFHVDVDAGRWTLIGEPGVEGILVRGRLQGSTAKSEVGMPLDLPPLEPFEPEGADAVPRPRSPNPVLRRRTRRTQWDLGTGAGRAAERAGEAEASAGKTLRDGEQEGYAEPQPSQARADSPAVDAAPGFEAPIPVASEEPDFELRTPTGEQPANLVDAHTSEADELPDLIAPGFDAPVDNKRAAAATDDPLADYGRSLTPGTLCLVRGVGVGERVARHVDGGGMSLVDDGDPTIAMRSVATEGPGQTIVVRLEDPSRLLGWVLRRLEEGSCVVIETRARTLAGARRTLLGIDAGPRADDWLSAHSLCWLSEDAGRWTLERA